MQPFSRDTTSTSDEKTKTHTTTTKRDVTSRGERGGEKQRDTLMVIERRTSKKHTHTHIRKHTLVEAHEETHAR